MSATSEDGSMSDLALVDELDQDLVIKLAKPITWPGGMLEEIVIPEPTAAQIEQWSGLVGTTAEIKAVAVMAELPVSVVKMLPARPFRRAVKRIDAFLG